jgi:hypothetical protein
VGLGFTGTVYTLNISNNTAASSTITGALTVAGGVGVGGTVFASNIRFPTTATTISSTTVASSVLNWYETGTFRPYWALTNTTTNFTAVTYSSNSGAYTKIGNVVQFSITMGITALTTASTNYTPAGFLCIAGLPYPPIAANPSQFVFPGYGQGFQYNFPHSFSVTRDVVAGPYGTTGLSTATNILIPWYKSATTPAVVSNNVGVTDLTNSTLIHITGSYISAF